MSNVCVCTYVLYACVLCVPMCVCLLVSIPYGPISESAVVAVCGDYCSIGYPYPMASKSEPIFNVHILCVYCLSMSPDNVAVSLVALLQLMLY